MEIEPGELFAGRYRIEKQVGRGGMGAVYLAEQEPLERRVAIKVLHGTADETTTARFQREARLIAQLQHPHIVGLIDFGEDDGRLFLVMEYIDGDSLTNVLKREAPLTPSRTCEIAIQIAEALSVAHDTQVVHRDVKPDNVMVLKTAAGGDFVKMLDFGVAKIKREENAQNTIETKAGLIVGSLRYISPEQVESGEITPRTDVYSFGCILYEMLTGRRVFDHPSPADCAIAHLTEKPRPPSVGNKALVGPLADLTMRCLEKQPAKRPADAREVLRHLMACRGEPAKLEGPLEVDEDKTVADVPGGLEAVMAEATRHEEVAPRPPISRAVPRPATSTVEYAMPDVQLRRPTGSHGFAVGAGDGPTSTHVHPAYPERVAPAGGGRLWLWLLLALGLGGAAFGIVWWVQQGAGSSAAGSTVAVTAAGSDAQADVAASPPNEPADSASAKEDAALGSPDGAADVALDVAHEIAPEVAPVIPGTRVVTEPEGAELSRDKKVLCKTPCTVEWRIDEKPPLLRLTLPGHIDIDLQLVRGDHGTEQRFELRPSKP